MSESPGLPKPPKITEEDLHKCRESGDYCPVFFEWYKFVGALCNFLACIRQDSPTVRNIEPLHYAVLIGLLNRCSRLMLSNVALSHEGLFGETTALIDRCIFESCAKAAWLCHNRSNESFVRYIADGLKTELELKASITSNIQARSGSGTLEIEKRMLASINLCIASSGLTEDEIAKAKKLPDLATMIDFLGEDRLMYIVVQKLGSHHVHGTWPSLRMHYLKENKEGMLMPRDHDCQTHINQYIIVPLVLLGTLRLFVNFIFSEAEDIMSMEEFIESIECEIRSLNKEVIGNDFELVEEI
jgi:Family of unknown function (DUF5677)